MNEWQNMNKSEKRVLVGMSGGIDSTATCLMLREQGYEIVGLTMWVWGNEPAEAATLPTVWELNTMWQMSVRLSGRLSFRTLLMNTGRGVPPILV